MLKLSLVKSTVSRFRFALFRIDIDEVDDVDDVGVDDDVSNRRCGD